MFDTFVTSLGRWVRGEQQPNDLSTAEAERRVWVRYPCTLETTCLPVNGPESVHLSAKVSNISRGGIGLTVNRQVEIGTFLSVELPKDASDLSSTVLAFVIRVSARPNGEWILGCTFATELNDEDLMPLGAQRVRAHTPDKRTWARFACDVEATCQSIRANEPEPWPARLTNLSASGGGLVVNRPIMLGAILSLELRSAGSQSPLTILTSVVRITALPGNEWALGCNFLRELSDQELTALGRIA